MKVEKLKMLFVVILIDSNFDYAPCVCSHWNEFDIYN